MAHYHQGDDEFSNKESPSSFLNEQPLLLEQPIQVDEDAQIFHPHHQDESQEGEAWSQLNSQEREQFLQAKQLLLYQHLSAGNSLQTSHHKASRLENGGDDSNPYLLGNPQLVMDTAITSQQLSSSLQQPLKNLSQFDRNSEGIDQLPILLSRQGQQLIGKTGGSIVTGTLSSDQMNQLNNEIQMQSLNDVLLSAKGNSEMNVGSAGPDFNKGSSSRRYIPQNFDPSNLAELNEQLQHLSFLQQVQQQLLNRQTEDQPVASSSASPSKVEERKSSKRQHQVPLLSKVEKNQDFPQVLSDRALAQAAATKPSNEVFYPKPEEQEARLVEQLPGQIPMAALAEPRDRDQEHEEAPKAEADQVPKKTRKNKQLMEELKKLKEEVDMLKQFQEQQQSVTSNKQLLSLLQQSQEQEPVLQPEVKSQENTFKRKKPSSSSSKKPGYLLPRQNQAAEEDNQQAAPVARSVEDVNALQQPSTSELPNPMLHHQSQKVFPNAQSPHLQASAEAALVNLSHQAAARSGSRERGELGDGISGEGLTQGQQNEYMNTILALQGVIKSKDTELELQKQEIEAQKLRIDNLEQMVQALVNQRAEEAEVKQDDDQQSAEFREHSKSGSKNQQDIGHPTEDNQQQRVPSVRFDQRLDIQTGEQDISNRNSAEYSEQPLPSAHQQQQSNREYVTFKNGEDQDTNQVMTKLDEHRQKRSEIEKYLAQNQIANFNDQSLFCTDSQVMVGTTHGDTQGLSQVPLGPMKLHELYKLNLSVSGGIRSEQKNKPTSFERYQNSLFNRLAVPKHQEDDSQKIYSGVMYLGDQAKGLKTQRTERLEDKLGVSLNDRGAPIELGVQPEFDANLIQSLFPDRTIKAQSFIDLLAANRGNDKQHLLRVQNPLRRKEQDIELAVKALVEDLASKGVNLQIKKIPGQDGTKYTIELPEQKTSGLRPRTARNSLAPPTQIPTCSSQNRFGAPHSHLPQDKIHQIKVKLNLSGGQLMVQTGGGHQILTNFLEHRGFFSGTQLGDAN